VSAQYIGLAWGAVAQHKHTPPLFPEQVQLTAPVPLLRIGLPLASCLTPTSWAATPSCTAAGTNIVGIFTMPPWLRALFSGTSELTMLVLGWSGAGLVCRRGWCVGGAGVWAGLYPFDLI